MGDYGKPGFVHLNGGDQWPGFTRRGLELWPDGTLSLFRVPRLMEDTPKEIVNAPVPDEPAGLAVTWDGSIFYTDRASGKLNRIGGCAGETSCSAGLNEPGALATVTGGAQIAIADSNGEPFLIYDPDPPPAMRIQYCLP